MLNDELRSWKYYQHLLPLYMQNSYGILEQFSILYNILLAADNTGNSIIKGLNIFVSEQEYFKDIDKDGYEYDILDKLASLYGVSRNFNVKYIDAQENTQKVAALHLSNKELWNLIKARIIKNNYSGTYEASRLLYEQINFPVYILNSGNSAEAIVYLDRSREYTSNEEIMFLAGLFTLDSMGITYSMNIGSISTVALWDSTDSNRQWDEGRWS